MGNALEAERCYEEALQCFRASLELEPENAELLYHQALLLEDLERTDEAIDAYAASASRGHSADALIRLSALLLRVGRAADALVPADEARSRHPLDGRGHLAAGRAAIALNRTADAEAFFRKALDVDPASEARLELARVLHLIGKEEDGLAVLRGIEAPDTGALLLRADIQRSLGRTDEALADEDAAIRAATEGRDLAYRHKGRLLLDEFGMAIPIDDVPIDEAEAGPHRLLLRGEEPIALVVGDGIAPTVRGLLAFPATKRAATVDMGAVRFIYNGADVMAPGITEADPAIREGDIVWVRDEKNRQPLAVGRAIMDGPTMAREEKGKAIETLHHVGDEIWRLAEEET